MHAQDYTIPKSRSEIESFMRAHYSWNGSAWCSVRLGMDVRAVRTRASVLKLRLDKDGPAYQSWRESIARASAENEFPKREPFVVPPMCEIDRLLFASGPSEPYLHDDGVGYDA